jgi:NAD(P)-dependent dehydrogenase (short-subunit alcohol dehydrogenase family)
MSLFDAFRFDGKHAVVVGGATGMGAAAAELLLDLGAEVTVMDFAEVTLGGAKSVHVNLAEKDSIDAAIGQIGRPVDALLSCAGVADGTPGISKINFIGHRHMIDQLIAQDLLPSGAAITFISSAAGLGWEASLEKIQTLLATPDWDGAVAWIDENGGDDYFNTKQFVCAYVAAQAYPMAKRGIRINAICPGPTDTPLAQANAEMWLGFGADYRAELGINAATPLEQGFPLVFLCSDAASGIAGITMITDAGYLSSGLAKSYEGAAPVAEFIFGRNADMEKMLAGEQ